MGEHAPRKAMAILLDATPLGPRPPAGGGGCTDLFVQALSELGAQKHNICGSRTSVWQRVHLHIVKLALDPSLPVRRRREGQLPVLGGLGHEGHELPHAHVGAEVGHALQQLLHGEGQRPTLDPKQLPEGHVACRQRGAEE